MIDANPTDIEDSDTLVDVGGSDATEVPESYELVIPDDLKGKIEPDGNDPRWAALQEVAKAEGMSQQTVNALLTMHYGHEASSAEFDSDFGSTQKTKLIEAFNDGGKLSDEAAGKAAQAVGDWASSLLKQDIAKNPGLQSELESIAVTADGVQLLAALKARMGETKPPGGRDVASGPKQNPLDVVYPTMAS